MPFLTLAASALGGSDLTARARQILPGLVEKTGLSAYLAVLEGTQIIYLLCETPDTPLVSRIRVGSRIPAHRATPGLAMLASQQPAALRALYAAHPEDDDQPDWDALNLALDTCGPTAAHGVFPASKRASIRARRRSGTAAGAVLAALSVAGPNSAFSADDALRQTVETSVKAAADALSRLQPVIRLPSRHSGARTGPSLISKTGRSDTF